MSSKANFKRALDYFREHGIKVSDRTLRRWVRLGKINAVQIGGRWFFDYADLDDAIQNGTPDQKSIVRIEE